MNENFLFQAGERVLCFHGPLMYEAKVLKCEFWKDRKDVADGAFYFVHYKGWKNTWDEWIPESRALKLNEDNLKKQAELIESTKSSKKGKAVDKSELVTTTAGAPKKKRRESIMEKVYDIYIRISFTDFGSLGGRIYEKTRN